VRAGSYPNVRTSPSPATGCSGFSRHCNRCDGRRIAATVVRLLRAEVCPPPHRMFCVHADRMPSAIRWGSHACVGRVEGSGDSAAWPIMSAMVCPRSRKFKQECLGT